MSTIDPADRPTGRKRWYCPYDRPPPAERKNQKANSVCEPLRMHPPFLFQEEQGILNTSKRLREESEARERRRQVRSRIASPESASTETKEIRVSPRGEGIRKDNSFESIPTADRDNERRRPHLSCAIPARRDGRAIWHSRDSWMIDIPRNETARLFDNLYRCQATAIDQRPRCDVPPACSGTVGPLQSSQSNRCAAHTVPQACHESIRSIEGSSGHLRKTRSGTECSRARTAGPC